MKNTYSRPCRFCAATNPQFDASRAAVRCQSCGSCGPGFQNAGERAEECAWHAWNAVPAVGQARVRATVDGKVYAKLGVATAVGSASAAPAGDHLVICQAADGQWIAAPGRDFESGAFVHEPMVAGAPRQRLDLIPQLTVGEMREAMGPDSTLELRAMAAINVALLRKAALITASNDNIDRDAEVESAYAQVQDLLATATQAEAAPELLQACRRALQSIGYCRQVLMLRFTALAELADSHHQETDHRRRLQRALSFWLPKVPVDDAQMAERAGADAMELIMYDGEPEASAEDLGWIARRAPPTSDAQQMTLGMSGA